MTEKRFTLTFDDKIVDNLTGIIHDVHSGYDVAMDLSGLLNELNDENEQLKSTINTLTHDNTKMKKVLNTTKNENEQLKEEIKDLNDILARYEEKELKND